MQALPAYAASIWHQMSFSLQYLAISLMSSTAPMPVVPMVTFIKGKGELGIKRHGLLQEYNRNKEKKLLRKRN